VKIELINTGTELLLGQVLNTHLPWLATQLFPFGIRITRQLTVPDGPDIQEALLGSINRKPDGIIITGGLGPTTDDLTREVVSNLLGLPLELDRSVLEKIQGRCSRRGIPFRESMGRQAMVPRGATVLNNENGTAPGLYFEPCPEQTNRQSHLFVLPGPPRELKPMFESCVLPRLQASSRKETIQEMKIFRVFGMGETALEEKIGKSITQSGELEVGYCARPNEVDFRLVGSSKAIGKWEPVVLAALGENLISTDQESLEGLVVRMLSELGATVATAESCTGGLLANRITNIPGASEVFLQGWVVYSNQAKTKELNIDSVLLREHGAVSAPAALALAEGALRQSGATYALSTTGIAGPGGGTAAQPVGTVFFGLASKVGESRVWKRCFPFDRETFKQTAAQFAFDSLRRELLGLQQKADLQPTSAASEPTPA